MKYVVAAVALLASQVLGQTCPQGSEVRYCGLVRKMCTGGVSCESNTPFEGGIKERPNSKQYVQCTLEDKFKYEELECDEVADHIPFPKGSYNIPCKEEYGVCFQAVPLFGRKFKDGAEYGVKGYISCVKRDEFQFETLEKFSKDHQYCPEGVKHEQHYQYNTKTGCSRGVCIADSPFEGSQFGAGYLAGKHVSCTKGDYRDLKSRCMPWSSWIQDTTGTHCTPESGMCEYSELINGFEFEYHNGRYLSCTLGDLGYVANKCYIGSRHQEDAGTSGCDKTKGVCVSQREFKAEQFRKPQFGAGNITDMYVTCTKDDPSKMNPPQAAEEKTQTKSDARSGDL